MLLLVTSAALLLAGVVYVVFQAVMAYFEAVHDLSHRADMIEMSVAQAIAQGDEMGPNLFRGLSKDGERWISHNVVAQEDAPNSPVSQRLPYEGESYPGRRNFVIEQNNFYINDYEVGDNLMVELPDGRIREMELIGKVRDQAGALMSRPESTSKLPPTPIHTGTASRFRRLLIHTSWRGTSMPTNSISGLA